MLKANRLINVPLALIANQLICRRCGQCRAGIYERANMSSNVRVRFAPSPTGDLHLGGLRTALYNYLFARKNNGTFILRCEDTDQTRLVPGVLEKMMDLLAWAGITPDEGPGIGGNHGPYKQSERLDLYRERVDLLLREGSAYRCFCSSQRLELLRRDQLRRRETFQGYDNVCRTLSSTNITEKLSSNTPYAIRFKLSGEVHNWKDLVFGEMSSGLNQVEGDPIILKSDGYPTYHLANVVDDHHMEITHVLRGAEWQSSMAKHLQLFSAFGWKPPQYAHLPLLMNKDGTKLSKRQDSLRLEFLQEKGYEPESIISLLSLSGGGVSIPHKQINENGVTLTTAIENFSLDSIRTDNSVLDMDRLPVLSQSCLLRMYKTESKETYCRRISEMSVSKGLLCPNLDKLYEKFLTYSERLSTLSGLFEGDLLFIWQRPDAGALRKLRTMENVSVEDCVAVINLLKGLGDDPLLTIDDAVKSFRSQRKIKKGVVYKIIRVVITGSEVGPPVTMLLDLLDKEEICARCDAALRELQGNSTLNQSMEQLTEL